MSDRLTFARLVNDEGDMAGHVAYALYTRDKLTFIETFRLDKGRLPRDDELDAFIVTANLDLRVSAYRSEAERSLEVFVQEVLEESTGEIARLYQRELCRQLARSRSFIRAVAENLAANLLAAACVAVLAVVLYGSRIGFGNLVADVFGYHVISRPSDPPLRPGAGDLPAVPANH